ncbi:hypothetical protein B0T09DRAFT_266372 [Sordaria sp. MPI-SDFR-AT-0083]|nr:hypothetical protein B0T09DRAFT_266372 [Sordaria sp. MPI-SDFR-AT-0083]
MPKRPRAMAPVADLATSEPNEDRRKRSRMALAAEEVAEEMTDDMDEEMTECMRTWLRTKLLKYYHKGLEEDKNNEPTQRKLLLESPTGSDDVEQSADKPLTVGELSKTIDGLLLMFETKKRQGQCDPSSESDEPFGDVDVVEMAQETTDDSDIDMDHDEEDEDKEDEEEENEDYDDENDDEEHGDDNNDEDEDDISYYHSDEVDGYLDGRGWYCLHGNVWCSDEDESENEEATSPENEYILSPWSVGDPSTPKDPFLEHSPQVDLMGAFHNERGNRDSTIQAVGPILRNPAILSLQSEADYENYLKRPRIGFGRPAWRA